MDRETVRKVARIARLELTEEEIDGFASDLEDILSNFSTLDEAEALDEHSFNPVDIEDRLREDSVCRFIDPAILREMMKTRDDWVRGPRLS